MADKVFENIYQIEVPLPGSPLKSVNCYVIKDERRDLLIDTGMNRPECRAAIEHGLGPLMRDHAGMNQRLMVNELVQLRGLGLAVEDQAAPETGSIQNNDVLVLRPAAVKYFLHPLRLNDVGCNELVVPVAFI